MRRVLFRAVVIVLCIEKSIDRKNEARIVSTFEDAQKFCRFLAGSRMVPRRGAESREAHLNVELRSRFGSILIAHHWICWLGDSNSLFGPSPFNLVQVKEVAKVRGIVI